MSEQTSRFIVYAKRPVDGVKRREVVGKYQFLDDAKKSADAMTSGISDYAYVRGTDGQLWFFVRRLDPAVYYGEGPIQPEEVRSIG